MIEITYPGNRSVRLMPLTRYNYGDGTCELAVWWEGFKYWCVVQSTKEKTMHEAREEGLVALKEAVLAGKRGRVVVGPEPLVPEMPPQDAMFDRASHMKEVWVKRKEKMATMKGEK